MIETQDQEALLAQGAPSDDEPFDVQAMRHTAYIHAVAQIGATAAFQIVRSLHRRGLMDADDLAPIHEIVSLLRDGLCPALLESDREMFEVLVDGLPR
jgi:hypothetical protein